MSDETVDRGKIIRQGSGGSRLRAEEAGGAATGRVDARVVRCGATEHDPVLGPEGIAHGSAEFAHSLGQEKRLQAPSAGKLKPTQP